MEKYIIRLGFKFDNGQWYKDNMTLYTGYFVDSHSQIECWTFTINSEVVFREETAKFYGMLKSYFRKQIIDSL